MAKQREAPSPDVPRLRHGWPFPDAAWNTPQPRDRADLPPAYARRLSPLAHLGRQRTANLWLIIFVKRSGDGFEQTSPTRFEIATKLCNPICDEGGLLEFSCSGHPDRKSEFPIGS